MRLTSDALGARIDELAEVLRRDGELVERHSQLNTSPTLIDFRIESPGGAAGHEMSFRYSESYERDADAWLMTEYVYLMSWQNGLGQLEYHWHSLPWSEGISIYHTHCQPPAGTREHFRGHVMLLEEARGDFLARYAAGEPVDCQGLYPLGTMRSLTP